PQTAHTAGPVVYTPVQVPVPVPVAVAPAPQQQAQEEEANREDELKDKGLTVYSHSNLFYWWPTWVVGFLMAALTYLQGAPGPGGSVWDMTHPSNGLGIVFFMTLLLVILITNINMHGAASGMVILGTLLVTVLLAYFGLWDRVLHWLGNLRIHLTL